MVETVCNKLLENNSPSDLWGNVEAFFNDCRLLPLKYGEEKRQRTCGRSHAPTIVPEISLTLCFSTGIISSLIVMPKRKLTKFDKWVVKKPKEKSEGDPLPRITEQSQGNFESLTLQNIHR